jgi:zinc transporter 5/7
MDSQPQLRLDSEKSFLLLLIFLYLAQIILEFGIGLHLRIFHLMGDSLHNLLNLLALAFTLISGLADSYIKNPRFSYGFKRLEMISAFTNCCFIIFLGAFLAFRAAHDFIERIGDAEDHDHSKFGHFYLTVFHIVRGSLYFLGFLLFYHYSKAPKINDLYSCRSLNNHSLYLQFKIGFFTSLIFLFSEHFSIFKAAYNQLILSGAMMVYCIYITRSPIKIASNILLGGAAFNEFSCTERIQETLSKLPEVTKIKQIHNWTLEPGHSILSINISVSDLEKKVLLESCIQSEAKLIFQEVIIDIKQDI